MSKARVTSRTVHSIQLDDGTELELEFQPSDSDEVLVERIGENKVVVGYNADDDADSNSNPLKNADCQGDIYTRNEGVITDNSTEILAALKLNGNGYSDPYPEFDTPLVLDGVKTTLIGLAAKAIFERMFDDEDLYERWIDENDLDLDGHESRVDVLNENRTTILRELTDENSTLCDEVTEEAEKLYKKHWQDVVGPYVVILNHRSQSYTMITPSTWDGDWDDLPNCIWVADKGAIENIDTSALPEGAKVEWQGACNSETDPMHAVATLNGEVIADIRDGDDQWGQALAALRAVVGEAKPEDIRKRAQEYARGVAEEYAEWCNGNVFGCVVEVFERQENGTWEKTDGRDNEVWGFVGREWAQKALKEDYFTPVVNHVKGN